MSLTESDIRSHTDPASFRRGVEYYQRGAIFDAVRQGDELRAECAGSQYEPYRVSVSLDQRGIAGYRCSCPRGGFCKHIVALLLTWVHEPGAFDVIPPLDELLAERSREELVALVKEMIGRRPELARLLELPLGPVDARPLDPEPFRKQVRRALTRDDAEAIGRELAQVCRTAERYLKAGQPAAAGDLYALVMDETLRRMEDWWLEWDEQGDIFGALHECAEGLYLCLDEVSTDEARRCSWLEVLLKAELEDIRLGGVDLAPPAADVVIERATDEEWEWIEVHLRSELQRADDWARAALVRFMASRRTATGRETEADTLILEQGTHRQRAFLLLHLGRIEEAVSIAAEHFADLPGLVIDFANALVETGHGEAAVAYMAGQMENGRYGRHYGPWLARHFQEHGNRQAALDQWRKEFEAYPSLSTYETLQELATELGVWQGLRPALIAAVDSLRYASLLVDIALEEGDVERALEIARQPGALVGVERWDRLAQAAEARFPRDSMGFYRRMAERAIAGRGRASYQVAAGYLRRLRDLHLRLGEAADWQAYIDRLRQEHHRLRALQDELNKAGL
ncbi:MAG TPA: hypothetical protein ENN99_07220 [Chloroflexi bacterium]|nr:hypothetical protein [Chloroflexota bacterium]